MENTDPTCKHTSTWFDRTICLREDGTERMATICDGCGRDTDIPTKICGLHIGKCWCKGIGPTKKDPMERVSILKPVETFASGGTKKEIKPQIGIDLSGVRKPDERPRRKSACLSCNQAIEIIDEGHGMETVIRAEENRRRDKEKAISKLTSLLEEKERELIEIREGLTITESGLLANIDKLAATLEERERELAERKGCDHLDKPYRDLIDRLKSAEGKIEEIIKHQEFVGGSLSNYSTVVVLAKSALALIRGEK